MNKLTYIFVITLLLSFLLTARKSHAQRPQNTFDASVMYTELHANAPVGGRGCFWMEGGTGEIGIPLWRNFQAVMQVNGEHTDHIPNFNVGLSLLTGLGEDRKSTRL